MYIIYLGGIFLKTTKLALKFITMSLIVTMFTAFTFTSFAFAKTDSQQEVSEKEIQAKKVLNEIKEIKNIDFKNEKETSKKKEYTLVIDNNEESQVTYDKEAGKLYVDGQLAASEIVLEKSNAQEGEAELNQQSSFNTFSTNSFKTYTIGSNSSSGIWIYKGYKSGSFQLETVSVATTVALISLILSKKPKAAALNAAAGAILTAAIIIDQYKIYWDMYSYKDQKKAYYQDSLSFYNYKGISGKNKIVRIIHYWGVL